MAPDRFFNKIRPENKGMFYAVIVLLLFSVMAMLVMAMSKADQKDKDTFIKVIGLGSGSLGILFLIIRQDKFASYMHESNHAIRGQNEQVIRTVNVAEMEITKAAEKVATENTKTVNEIQKTLEQQLPATIEQTVKKTLTESPVPTTHAEWVQFVKEVNECAETADLALEKFYTRLINEGYLIKPDSNKPLLMTPEIKTPRQN